MRGDARSRRIPVVPDAVVNPAGGGTTSCVIRGRGLGRGRARPPGRCRRPAQAWMAAIVDQVVTFLDDGYELALAGPVTEEVNAFVDALGATGHHLTERVDPAE